METSEPEDCQSPFFLKTATAFFDRIFKTPLTRVLFVWLLISPLTYAAKGPIIGEHESVLRPRFGPPSEVQENYFIKPIAPATKLVRYTWRRNIPNQGLDNVFMPVVSQNILFGVNDRGVIKYSRLDIRTTLDASQVGDFMREFSPDWLPLQDASPIWFQTNWQQETITHAFTLWYYLGQTKIYHVWGRGPDVFFRRINAGTMIGTPLQSKTRNLRALPGMSAGNGGSGSCGHVVVCDSDLFSQFVSAMLKDQIEFGAPTARTSETGNPVEWESYERLLATNWSNMHGLRTDAQTNAGSIISQKEKDTQTHRLNPALPWATGLPTHRLVLAIQTAATDPGINLDSAIEDVRYLNSRPHHALSHDLNRRLQSVLAMKKSDWTICERLAVLLVATRDYQYIERMCELAILHPDWGILHKALREFGGTGCPNVVDQLPMWWKTVFDQRKEDYRNRRLPIELETCVYPEPTRDPMTKKPIMMLHWFGCPKNRWENVTWIRYSDLKTDLPHRFCKDCLGARLEMAK